MVGIVNERLYLSQGLCKSLERNLRHKHTVKLKTKFFSFLQLLLCKKENDQKTRGKKYATKL